VPEPSAFALEMGIQKLKRHKSPGVDRIPFEWIESEGRTIRFEIHELLILFRIRRSEGSRSLYLFIRRVIKQIVIIIVAFHLGQLGT
jgi:hypothetical protein